MSPPARSGARLLTRLRQVWFGPSMPLAPEAPPETAGRQFDYPVGFNLRLSPRQDEGTSFAELRGLADAYDLVRLVIETRKDQVEALDWQIRPRRGGPSDDPRISAIEDLLRSPDREHPWGTWVRLLLEDLFVLDAPTLYVRRTASGTLWGLEVVDGATIKRLLGPDGRTPRSPDPAYQQVLKGIPAVDYTSDEMIYAPRNPRPHKVYGYSPVEQILMTVNIGLRRQVSQLNYFTEGNTPEALIGVPEAWTPDQIWQFQEYWDALLEGNLAARRHTRFVPGGLKYQPIRDVPLKDEFDEWLARVVCFAFSIPPTAFSKTTNRATAESAQDAATAEGLQPLLVWLKGLIDRIIAQVLGCPELEFAWSDRTAPDPQSQAQIAAAYVGAGIKTRNEVRAELGLDPVAGGDTLTTVAPAAPLPAGMVKFNPNWQTQPRDRGQWATSGGSSNSARLILVGGTEEEAETPGEERLESFNEMPPYLQASILSVRDPTLRGRLMDDQDLAETYYQYGQAAQRLRAVDPKNPLLDTVHAPDWLPTDDDVVELRSALNSSKDPPRSSPSFQTTKPITVSGRRAIDASQAYEEGVRNLYGNQSIKPRRFPVITENSEAINVADEVVVIDGLDTAIEAKYVADWSQSLRNPASPMGQRPWAIEEQQRMINQAKTYSDNFDGGVIYHTNNQDFATYYSQEFQKNRRHEF